MTTARLALSALIPIAYVVGSVPFGLLVGLSRGIDVREQGSGNIGATNVGRLLGVRFFALVFVLDLLKGLLPTLMAAEVLHYFKQMPDVTDYILWLLVGFAAIAGHMYSLFLKFKGGKGVATSTGVILGVFPYFTFAGLVGMLVWIILFKVTRYVSVASMLGAICFPIAYLAIGLCRRWPIFGMQFPLTIFSVLIASMIVLKHRDNLSRLRAGTEHRFSRQQAAPGH